MASCSITQRTELRIKISLVSGLEVSVGQNRSRLYRFGVTGRNARAVLWFIGHCWVIRLSLRDSVGGYPYVSFLSGRHAIQSWETNAHSSRSMRETVDGLAIFCHSFFSVDRLVQ